MRSRKPRWRVHGLERRDLQNLASLRRRSRSGGDGMTTLMQPTTGRITLKQGGGGRDIRALVEGLLVPDFAGRPFDGVGIAAMDDGAAVRIGDDWLVITTDSHVIHPIFFPGGDIGRLSICGTVNDLAMMGATNVLALTCSVILEE